MGLTSTAFLVLLALGSVAAPGCLVLLWTHVPGPRLVKALTRLSLIVVSQVAAVSLTLVAVNDQYGFFTSWPDVFGTPPTPGVITTVGSQQFTGPFGGVSVNAIADTGQRDGSHLITENVTGLVSGISGRVIVDLPRGYATSQHSYPVVELLQGWHTGPSTWVNNLGLLRALKTEERVKALGPVIVVMPDINVASPRDVECTNVPQGPQAESWLTTDIRDLVVGQFRALPTARNWAAVGFSTGGYCAVKFALRRPGWFAAAAALSGYFDALKDRTTGDLWGGSAQARRENAPLWLITQTPLPPVSLLVFASRYDKESYPSTAEFLALPHGTARVFSLITPHGGHNFKDLSAALPEVLGWVGQQLSYAQGAHGSELTTRHVRRRARPLPSILAGLATFPRSRPR